ncbi:MAG: ester cyclase [Thermomicrobiales bacterium]
MMQTIEHGRRQSDRTRTMLNAYLEDLLGGGEFGQHMAETVTFTMMETGEVTQGRDAVVGLIDFMHHQAFDATPVVGNLIVDDSQAALEADFVATHVGEFAGIGPTGRQVSVPYAVAYDIEDESITALRMYMSMGSLVGQLREG